MSNKPTQSFQLLKEKTIVKVTLKVVDFRGLSIKKQSSFMENEHFSFLNDWSKTNFCKILTFDKSRKRKAESVQEKSGELAWCCQQCKQQQRRLLVLVWGRYICPEPSPVSNHLVLRWSLELDSVILDRSLRLSENSSIGRATFYWALQCLIPGQLQDIPQF